MTPPWPFGLAPPRPHRLAQRAQALASLPRRDALHRGRVRRDRALRGIPRRPRCHAAGWYVHRGMMGHVIIEKGGASSSEGRRTLGVRAAPPRTGVHRRRSCGTTPTSSTARARPAVRRARQHRACRSDVRRLGPGRSRGAGGAARLGVERHRRACRCTRPGMTPSSWATAWAPCSTARDPRRRRALRSDGKPTGERRPDGLPPAARPAVVDHRNRSAERRRARSVGLFDAGLKDIDNRFLHLPLALAQRLADTEAVTMYAVLLRDERLCRPSSSRLRGGRPRRRSRPRGRALERAPHLRAVSPDRQHPRDLPQPGRDDRGHHRGHVRAHDHAEGGQRARPRNRDTEEPRVPASPYAGALHGGIHPAGAGVVGRRPARHLGPDAAHQRRGRSATTPGWPRPRSR